MSNEGPEATEIKTMWSESLLESLYVALRKQKEDKIVREVIADLRAKGYGDEYLMNKVKQKVGTTAAARIESLLTGKKPRSSARKSSDKVLSKAEQARANAARKRAQESWFVKLKRLFGIYR